jgi:hypothetical protein
LETPAIECTDPHIYFAFRWRAGFPVFRVSHPEKATPGRIYLFAVIHGGDDPANDPESNEQDLADE